VVNISARQTNRTPKSRSLSMFGIVDSPYDCFDSSCFGTGTAARTMPSL
jgi:hypothetical protein